MQFLGLGRTPMATYTQSGLRPFASVPPTKTRKFHDLFFRHIADAQRPHSRVANAVRTQHNKRVLCSI